MKSKVISIVENGLALTATTAVWLTVGCLLGVVLFSISQLIQPVWY